MAPSTAGEVEHARAGAATVALVDGFTMSGELDGFSPNTAEIVLNREGVLEPVPTANIAYVAFRRSPDEPIAPRDASAERYKIYARGGETFVVDACPPAGDLAIGFRAVPVAADSPYRELYFFLRGVRAREKDEPIGAMLVRSGAVHPEVLAHAIATQETHRATPIGRILVESLSVREEDVAQAIAQQKQRNQRVGELLIEQGLATVEDIEAALSEQQRRKRKRLGELLLELNIVSEETLGRTLARKFDMRFVDLNETAPNALALKEVPKELVARRAALPIDKTGDTLVVAVSDPLSLDAIDEIRSAVDRPIEAVLATPRALKRRLDDVLGSSTAGAQRPEDELEMILERLTEIPASPVEEVFPVVAIDDPNNETVAGLLERIISQAHERGASDIHIEPNGADRNTTVRLRVDGVCIVAQDVSAAHRNALVSRVKMLAGLDASERRKPQAGKVHFDLRDGPVEFRVVSIPTIGGGEDVVLTRIRSAKPLRLSDLGLSERNRAEMDRLLHERSGLFLCVGPARSGRTTALHSAIACINTVDKAIWSFEDPVEITQPGVRQIRLDPDTGSSYRAAVRVLMRADADVILVGDMSDADVSAMLIEAALGGHLVLSALHANDAPQSVTRLLTSNDPSNVANALLGVLAVRVARGLCTECRKQTALTEQEYGAIANAYPIADVATDTGISLEPGFAVWRAAGCDACGGTGYKGAVGLQELLVCDEPMRTAISRRASAKEIRAIAQGQGMRTLLQDGIAKALAGETDLVQIRIACR